MIIYNELNIQYYLMVPHFYGISIRWLFTVNLILNIEFTILDCLVLIFVINSFRGKIPLQTDQYCTSTVLSMLDRNNKPNSILNTNFAKNFGITNFFSSNWTIYVGIKCTNISTLT